MGKKKFIFYDHYTVRFWKQKKDGFWQQCEEDVKIPLKNERDPKEKKLHAAAEKIILDKYPNIVIISVKYL
jgi:hypothetical protein